MSRFPKLSETFVLNEILALERLGFGVEIHPLLRERVGVAHPEAEALVARAHFLPFVSPGILASQWRWLRTRPGTYLGLVRDLVRDTWRSPRLLAGGLAILPKAAHHAALMAEEGIAHVHCHFATHAAFAGLVAHRLTGLPFSFTAHGFDIHVDRSMLARKAREAAFVVAISEYNRRVILEEAGPAVEQGVHVVHCGVDPERFRPAEPGTGLGSPDAPFTVVAVGRLEPVKGHAILVEALGLLADAGYPVRGRIAGSGSLETALRSRIEELGLSGTVELLGGRTASEVAELMRAADVVVQPSIPTPGGRSEGIPVVLMEALASGVPVVASNLTGIPELVEHDETGLLVVPGDVRGLADAIRRLYDDPPLRARLAAAGRRRVHAEFDLHANAARLGSLIEGAAA